MTVKEFIKKEKDKKRKLDSDKYIIKASQITKYDKLEKPICLKI